MRVANLELCKELFEVSGWDLDEHDKYLSKWWWSLDGVVQDWAADRYKLTPDQVVAPAYDLGYLLRKLPDFTELHKEYADGKVRWNCTDENAESQINGVPFAEPHIDFEFYDNDHYADTPEDAACKLAIELFEQNILTKESK